MKIAIIWALVLTTIAMMIVPHSFVQAATNPNTVAKTKITAAIDKAVNGQWKGICEDAITTGFNQSLKIVYDKNNTRCNGTLIPSPQPPTCLPTEHIENGKCVPNPVPPTPTGDKTIVCLIGDLKGSTVPNMMNKGGCNYKIGLGDLGYQSDLSYFKSLNFNKCVIGNHDSTEDGSSSIYKEALAYCGDHWSLKIGNSTLILGFNTNGDISSQVASARSVISSNTQVKTIILVSHKAGHVPPNSHHPAEAASLYAQLESIIPANVHLYEVVGHNHVSSAAPSKNWYQAGAGGKSFYGCGTDSVWTYCDNKNLQYLELVINNTDGTTKAQFVK
jgi:hypothetical protein